jgi:hypothetical protein
MLWVRALHVRRTKRWSFLFRDLPLSNEDLLAWLNQLLQLAQEHESEPFRAKALVAGWVSECDLQDVSDAMLKAEVQPVEPTDAYIAQTPVSSPIRIGDQSATALQTAEALRAHPCVDHLFYPEAAVRELLEGKAWCFDFSDGSGSRLLAVFRDDDEDEKLVLVAPNRLISDLEPWRPLIEAIRTVLGASPDVRGNSAYRTALAEVPTFPLPRSESLEDQLAWARQQALSLSAFEFMEAATRLRRERHD